MDFTREPIIETIVTPKEGCKLVVRSSKSVGQEEYFVDSIEVISFGNALFYRSLERPKAFLVPASDYEILEVREARMVLKNVGLDRSIKIGGGREHVKPTKEIQEKAEIQEEKEYPLGPKAEPREKKRERRRHYRRRREREEVKEEPARPEEKGEVAVTAVETGEGEAGTQSFISSLLPPPTTLISDTIGRYKTNDMFKGAFYSKEEKPPSLPQPEYGSYEMTEVEEEEIYKERLQRYLSDEEANFLESPSNEIEEGSHHQEAGQDKNDK